MLINLPSLTHEEFNLIGAALQALPLNADQSKFSQALMVKIHAHVQQQLNPPAEETPQE